MTHDEWWITVGGEIPTKEDIINRKFVPGEMVAMYNDSKTSWDVSRRNTLEEIVNREIPVTRIEIRKMLRKFLSNKENNETD